MSQPDFGMFFHSSEPRAIDYQTRSDANGRHDLVYISSYVHDARFRPSDVRLSGDRIAIPIERDCWELLRWAGQLVSVRSELTAWPVRSFRWGFSSQLLTDDRRPSELQFSIATLYLVPGLFGQARSCRLFIVTPCVQLVVKGMDDTMDVRVRDLEAPCVPPK